MTPKEKVEQFLQLANRAVEKFNVLDARAVDKNPAFRPKWILVEKTMKVIDHKVKAITALALTEQAKIGQTLDRTLKAAELLNLELDELLAATKSE